MDEIVALPGWRQAIVLAPLSGLLLACAWTDLRERKIYNKLVYPGFVVGLAAHTIAMGWEGLTSGLLAAAVMLVVALVLLPFRWIGAGDLKLLIATGAFVGGSGLLRIAFYAALVGAVMGLVGALFGGYLSSMLRSVGRYVKGWLRAMSYGDRELAEPLERDPRATVPFAVAIFFGGLLAYADVAWGWPGWFEIFRDVWF